MHQSQKGTPLYNSLQQLRVEPYTSKGDIWSIGVIFYELLHGFPPWTANSEFALIKEIQNKPLKVKEGLH